MTTVEDVFVPQVLNVDYTKAERSVVCLRNVMLE